MKTALLLAILSTSVAATEPVKGRVHVLIAVDTDDVQGITWRRDGINVQALLESLLKKQKLVDRAAITMLTGREVSPRTILDYYKTLRIDPEDTLLFYYSGHGGYHINKGHFLALTHGKLDRGELISAMEGLKPRLCVVLTDCCSNYAGGAWKAEPPGGVEKPGRRDLGKRPPAKIEEPKVALTLTRRPAPNRIAPPRPNLPTSFDRARVEEPVHFELPIVGPPPLNGKLAKKAEPGVVSDQSLSGLLPTLTTHRGRTPMSEILDASDGAILRDLLFRQKGVVDINACKKGELSYGVIHWGGSLFTNSLIAVQQSRSGDLDTNRDGVVAWSEFFPILRQATTDAGTKVPREKIQQVPEANVLNGK